jgi:hypothetical protein
MSWKAEISLKNNIGKSVKCIIPKGQVFENKKVGTGYQNVAAAQEYVIEINPYSEITIEIDVLCINKNLLPPEGDYNLAFFKVSKNFTNQDDLWKIMSP